jgi:alanine dehydrogenase
MLYLTEQQVRQLLPMREALRLMREVFGALARGEAGNQSRRRMLLPNGSALHSLAGWWKGYFGTKVYTTSAHGANFIVWLCEADTGKPLALFEANLLGQIRTGAASGLATDLMARQNAKTMGLIGSGFQAWTQLEAVLAVRPLERVRVYSRTAENRSRFAGDATKAFGVPVEPVETGEAAVRDADIVATVTFAKDPVVEAAWLKPGVHITAAGSNRPQRRELATAVVHGARWIAVDSLDQARIEAGDLLLAGDLDKLPIVELQELAGKGMRPRAPGDMTLFKSLGLGVEDVIVAAYVYERALAEKVGSPIPASTPEHQRGLPANRAKP